MKNREQQIILPGGGRDSSKLLKHLNGQDAEQMIKRSERLQRISKAFELMLQEEGIAGIMILHEPGFGELVVEIEPAYSAIIQKPGGGYKVSTKDIIDPQERLFKIQDTANMLSMFTGALQNVWSDLHVIFNGIKQHYKIVDSRTAEGADDRFDNKPNQDG